MNSATDPAEIAERRICADCVGEPFLGNEIDRYGKEASCFYCSGQGKAFSVEEMADRVEAAIDQHFEVTARDPDGLEYAMMKESDYEWYRKGEPVGDVIQEIAAIDAAPAEDIRLVLEDRHGDFDRDAMGEEGPFDDDTHYAENGVNIEQLQSEWRKFERTLRTEARFFSRPAEATLAAIFTGLSDHETRDGRRVIVEAGPEKDLRVLFRARAFEADDGLADALKRPDREIGPPPALAAVAGRMNARGISVFYGADDPAAALAEVRPPVGSRVAIGRFEIMRPLRLLDVEALRSVLVKGSFFDSGYIRRLEHAKFLRSLGDRITMPVMPSDEAFDYLATQAIADYLASEVQLDGIIYPSVQASEGKRNVVLFHKASRVEPLQVPKDTELTARLYESTDEGSEVDYSVWEEVPPEAPPKLRPDARGFPELPAFPERSMPEAYDSREITMRLDTQEVKVHHVQAVSFTSKVYSVRRHRFEKTDNPEF